MKKPIITTVLLCLCFLGFSQKMKFKEKINVFIADKANENYPVKFTDEEKTKKTNVIYNATGDTLSYQQEKVTDWDKAKVLNDTTAQANNIKKFELLGGITPKEGRLIVHFYPFIEEKIKKKYSDKKKARLRTYNQKIKKANEFFDSNTFFIELEPRENLGFHYSRFHLGALTLPMKIYLSSRAENNNNNVETDANINIYGGWLFGTKRYVKLPSEEEYRVYEYGWSLNGLVGLNKLDIGDKNTLDTSSFQGSLVTSSLGINVGWHYKIFSIFASYGYDIPLSSKGKDWHFKGKPWIGFGAGFEIF